MAKKKNDYVVKTLQSTLSNYKYHKKMKKTFKKALKKYDPIKRQRCLFEVKSA